MTEPGRPRISCRRLSSIHQGQMSSWQKPTTSASPPCRSNLLMPMPIRLLSIRLGGGLDQGEKSQKRGAQSDDDSAADDDDPETSDGRDCPLDEIPLEREDPEDEVPESPPEDSYHSSPAPSHGNDDAEDRDIMHDVDNICDIFYNSPLIAPDALVRINATVISFFLPTHHFL